MKKTFGIIAGAVLIVAGVLFALDVLGIMQLDISFAGWWTVFIIAPSLYGLVMHKDKTGNLIVLAIGVYLLLAARGVIEYGTLWKLVVPTIVILIGIKLIVKAVRSGSDYSETVIIDDESAECSAVFGTKSQSYTGSNVKAAHVGAVFGGAKCNFTDAKFDKDSSINLFCVFGGADLIIPQNVDIKMNALCLFGGISDKRNVNPGIEKTAALTINGLCLFGGADIK